MDRNDIDIEEVMRELSQLYDEEYGDDSILEEEELQKILKGLGEKYDGGNKEGPPPFYFDEWIEEE